MAEQKNQIAKAEQENQIAKIDKFTNAVVACYGDVGNGFDISDRERDIIKGYFLSIDLALKNSKDGYNWSMVNIATLAPRLKHYARLGLDMQMDNQLFPIPYRNGNTGKIDMNLIRGYEGYKYIAKRFAIEPFDDIIVRLVGKNDTFKPIYKDANHECDSYIYEETNPFDKGEIIGGFAYTIYHDHTKNKLLVMSLADIKKHKPKKGNPIWDGEWKEKMWLKTLVIEAAKKVPLDSEKVREYKQDLARIEADEMNSAAATANAEASEKMGSGDVIDFDADFTEVDTEPEHVDKETGEILPGAIDNNNQMV